MNAPLRARKRYDYFIVGAGFAGSILAERLASQHAATVLLIDRRPHIGGNAFDEKNDAGILYHKYGPHIFHTNSEQVVDYLSQFTEWRPYEHRVRAVVRGQLVPIPINRTTLNKPRHRVQGNRCPAPISRIVDFGCMTCQWLPYLHTFQRGSLPNSVQLRPLLRRNQLQRACSCH